MKKILILAVSIKENSIPEAVQKRINSKGVECDYKTIGDVYIKLENGKEPEVKVDQASLSDYGFVFLRTIGKHVVSREIATIIAKECERLKIKYIDKVHAGYITDNKLIAGYMLNINKVSIPKTIYKGIVNDDYFRIVGKEIGYPCIIKKTNSEKAKDVFLIKSEDELRHFNEVTGLRGHVIQQLINSKKDCRIYLVDKDVGFTVLRKSKDVIKNVNIGAKREYIEPTKEMKRIAINASKATGLTFSGVDILESEEGSLYVLEVNRAPAFSGENGPSDKFDFLADYIIENLS